MSYQRVTHRSIRRLPAIALATAALLILAACSSTTAGRPNTTSSDTARPPQASFDVSIYLCGGALSNHTTCVRSGPPGAQLSELRTMLRSDPSVRSLLFLDTEQTFRLGQKLLPASQIKYLRVGDQPAQFLVSLIGGAGAEPAFAAKYRKMGDVQNVVSCLRTPKGCSAKVLRSVGIDK